ncbi:MAG: 30S ribosomal protein S8 [Nanoarchaeota archaeon]|nr:30S ribosomal protein S8 [Nanoarchaeota archaeon]MBU1135256.1 30S ribosomal protein S8 [Nanoarchaeota archaeon]MBU2519894.1 30S ribosomal protein S8 [Nanoarchaeota archaeon]
MRHDLVADMFCGIKNAEMIGKKDCLTPSSKVIESVLDIMKKQNYIGDFTKIKDGKGDKIKVNLIGNINDCNIIKPRFAVKKNEFFTWEKKYLPANNVGILILTTSKGIMDQKEAKVKDTGGRLIGFVY